MEKAVDSLAATAVTAAGQAVSLADILSKARGEFVVAHNGPREIYRSRAEGLVKQLAEFEAQPLAVRLAAHDFYDDLCKRLYEGCEYERKSEDELVRNTIMDEGVNEMLDKALAGSGYTVVGPYMGLISSVSYSAIAAGNVGTQINGTNGWKEAGGTNAPTYSGTRKTCAWSAASARAKALSAGLLFTFTGSGTVKGMFIVFGSGAVSTIDSAAANTKLWCAGLFGADKNVVSTDTLTVSYSTTIN